MFEDLKVWKNGEIVPWGNATVHLMSHGFSRASAFFDVFGVYPSSEGTAAFRMDKYLDRLFRSAELLGMQMRYTRKEIKKASSEIIKVNNINKGLIKILAYFSEEAIINLVLDTKLDLTIFGMPERDEMGIDDTTPKSICFSSWRKIHPATVPVEAKACSNYLNGMFARRDAKKRGFDVGILLTTDGYAAEGSIESVFMVKDGILQAPKIGNIVKSIARMSIIEAAPSIGIKVVEKQITPIELMEADEIFLSHTASKVQPVNRIEGRTIKECPGPVTRKLIELMKDICESKNEQFKKWMQPIE